MSYLLRRIFIEPFSQYRGLPKPIYMIAFQRLITSLGGFVYPFLTLFMTQRLGLSTAEAGKWVLVSALVGLPGSLFAGAVIDKMNRKGILVVSRIASAIVLGACGFLEPDMMIIYFVILANFISSFTGPASSAMMSDLTQPKNRKQCFSLLYLAMNMGLAVSFSLAGFLFNEYWQWLFIGDALTSIISLIPFILFVPETRPTEKEMTAIDASDREGEKRVAGGLLAALVKRPFLFAFVLVNSVVGFVYNQHSFLMPIHLSDLFGSALGPQYFGWIMSTNTILVILLTPLIMSMTKGMQPIVNMILAAITYMIGFGMLTFNFGLSWFFVAVVIWTVGEIIGAVNTGVYISNHSPVNHRGRFSSVIGIIQFAGKASSPAIMGAFLMSHTNNAAWVLTGAMALLCAVAFMSLYALESKKYSESEKNTYEQRAS